MACEHHTSPFLLDSLYCQEQHFVDDDDDYQTLECKLEPLVLDQDLFREEEEEELSSLLSKEELNLLYSDFENNPLLVKSRRDAVEWMLRVVRHYSFSSLTAVLAVNYLDRFMFKFEFKREKLWMIQLVSVSCLSLAAKMEEVHVPLLMDLQVRASFIDFDYVHHFLIIVCVFAETVSLRSYWICLVYNYLLISASVCTEIISVGLVLS